VIITKPFKPTRQQLIAAHGKTLPDVIAPNLRVLFCGINPGLYTAAVGHHFARPGNRFWPALHKSGFTDRLLSPFEERELLKSGVGISNVVPFATASAAELTRDDFIAGGRQLSAKVKRYNPRIVAILGVGAYRHAFDKPKAHIGEQPGRIHNARVWVLPNPSGLNANYQLPELAKLFKQLRRAVDEN
jgi:TDG/mug DNA glycosylase family protein